MKHYLLIFFLLCGIEATAQDVEKLTFFEPADEFDKIRFWGLNSGVTAGYTGTLFLLNEYWYKGYEKSSFHFFDDRYEWLQMDKSGHALTSYLLASWGSGLYQWTGLSRKEAAWAGGIAGTVLMTTIEVLDGFSAKWGASWSDLAVNTGGAALFVGQEMLWEEQRVRLKISAFPQKYPADIQPRIDNLYGETAAEWLIKDYNAVTIWISTSPSDFYSRSSWWPDWLNIAGGYGANGLLGGFENKWCASSISSLADCDPQHLIHRSDIPRYRQYYLSLDVDLTKIKTNSRFLRTILYMANIIKIPAPALEYNRIDGMKWHWIMF